MNSISGTLLHLARVESVEGIWGHGNSQPSDTRSQIVIFVKVAALKPLIVVFLFSFL